MVPGKAAKPWTLQGHRVEPGEHWLSRAGGGCWQKGREKVTSQLAWPKGWRAGRGLHSHHGPGSPCPWPHVLYLQLQATSPASAGKARESLSAAGYLVLGCGSAPRAAMAGPVQGPAKISHVSLSLNPKRLPQLLCLWQRRKDLHCPRFYIHNPQHLPCNWVWKSILPWSTAPWSLHRSPGTGWVHLSFWHET